MLEMLILIKQQSGCYGNVLRPSISNTLILCLRRNVGKKKQLMLDLQWFWKIDTGLARFPKCIVFGFMACSQHMEMDESDMTWTQQKIFFFLSQMSCFALSLIKMKANHDEDGVDVPSSSHALLPAYEISLHVQKKKRKCKSSLTALVYLFFFVICWLWVLG